jgi:hypothetical protein
LNEYWLPSIRAAVELAWRIFAKPSRFGTNPALRTGGAATSTNVLLYPIYLRGEAYLAAGLPDKAQAEFQKILDHPGLVGNYLLGALAHLGIGRAYAMEAGIPVVPNWRAFRDDFKEPQADFFAARLRGGAGSLALTLLCPNSLLTGKITGNFREGRF